MLRDAGSLRNTFQLGLHYFGEAGLSNWANHNERRDLNQAEIAQERVCDRWQCRCTHRYIVVGFHCEMTVGRTAY